LIALLTACGGGGGSSSSSGLPQAVNVYTGYESDASVTDQATAEDILLSMAYASQSEELGSYVTSVSVDASGSTIGQDKIKNILAEKFRQDAENIAKNLQQQIVTGASYIVAGNCADILGSPENGSASQKTVSQSNSQIVVDIAYKNLCYTDGSLFKVELNGTMRITIKGTNLTNESALIAEMGLYIPDVSVKFTDLNSSEIFQDSLTLSMVFTFEYDATDNPIGGTVTMVSNIDYLNTVYRFRYHDDGTTEKVEFYHPEHGVVEINSNVEFETCSAVNNVPVGTASIKNTSTDSGAIFTGNNDCATYEICLTDGSGVVVDSMTDCTVYAWP
jgi:hypothetical protein